MRLEHQQLVFFIAGESGKPSSSASVSGPPGQKEDRGDVGAQGEKRETGKSGVNYVRWGRTTCPNGAEIVYKGTLGSS